jgi:hypothetical protein
VRADRHAWCALLPDLLSAALIETLGGLSVSFTPGCDSGEDVKKSSVLSPRQGFEMTHLSVYEGGI